MKNSGIIARACYSLQGLRLLWREERSFRTHCYLSSSLLVLVSLTGPSPTWYAIVLLAICIGLACEAANAAIERLCNRIHADHDPAIGAIKDIASAAAFLANSALVLVALVYFFGLIPDPA